MSPLDGNGEDLRHVVRLQLQDARLQPLVLPLPRLQQHQHLVLVLHLPLPPVDRAQRRQDVGASGQLLADQRLRHFGRRVRGRQRGQDQDGVGHLQPFLRRPRAWAMAEGHLRPFAAIQPKTLAPPDIITPSQPRLVGLSSPLCSLTPILLCASWAMMCWKKRIPRSPTSASGCDAIAVTAPGAMVSSKSGSFALPSRKRGLPSTSVKRYSPATSVKRTPTSAGALRCEAAFETLPPDRAAQGGLYERVKAGTLCELDGVGKAIDQKVTELVNTGKLDYLEKLRLEFPRGALDLVQIPGLGPRKAAALIH